MHLCNRNLLERGLLRWRLILKEPDQSVGLELGRKPQRRPERLTTVGPLLGFQRELLF